MRNKAALIVSVTMALMLIAASGSAFADDDHKCEDIEARIQSTADFTNFTTAGTIKGDLKGTTALAGDPLSLAPVPGAADTLSYVGALTVTTKKGSFTTFETGIFEPAPGGAGTSFDKIVSGTGRYTNATGVLYANFVSDATGASFDATLTGEICGIGDDDDDDD